MKPRPLRELRKANGLCVECGAQRDSGSGWNCRRCLDKQMYRTRLYRQRLTDARLCHGCRRPSKKYRCPQCQKHHAGEKVIA